MRIQTYKNYKAWVVSHKKFKDCDINFERVDDRFYYVYRITNTLCDTHYYGQRTSSIEPTKDIGVRYFSSTRSNSLKLALVEDIDHIAFKVVRVFNNKGDKICYEAFLHQYHDVSQTNNALYNKYNSSPFGYDRTGIPWSEEARNNQPERKLKRWWNNGVEQKHTPICPDGWCRGRLDFNNKGLEVATNKEVRFG